MYEIHIIHHTLNMPIIASEKDFYALRAKLIGQGYSIMWKKLKG